IQAKVNALIQDKRIDEAIAFVQDRAKADDKNFRLMGMLGRLYVLKRDTKNAQIAFEGAVKLKDDYLPARLELARIASEANREGDAIAHLQQVLKSEPGNIPAAL